LLILFFIIGLQLALLPSSVVATDKTLVFAIMGKAADTNSDGLSYSIHPILFEWLKLDAYFGMFFPVLNTVKSKKEIDILFH